MNRRCFIKTGLIYVPTIFACNQGIARLGDLEPEAVAWIRRIRSLSAGYTSKSVVCNDLMLKLLKAYGLRSRIVHMNTFTGIGINALLAPLLTITPGANDANVSFVDADYSEPVGLVGSGSRILSGCSQADLYNLDGTNHSFSYGCYISASNNQSGFAMGRYDGTDYVYLYVSNVGGQSFFSGGETANQITVSDSAGSGFYCGSRYSSTSMKLFKRGVEIGSTATAGTTNGNNYWVGVCDVNNQNTTGVAFSSKTFGGYLCANSIAVDDQPKLSDVWQRGMRVLGRAVS